jgi:hypothetical protein
MGDDCECGIPAVAATIEGYLRERPDACDSLKGIADWWIARHRLQESLERTQAALDLLERNGVVQKVHRLGSTFYCLATRVPRD